MLLETVLDQEGVANVEGVLDGWLQRGGAKDRAVVTRGVARGDLRVVSEATEGVVNSDKQLRGRVWERGTGSTGLLSDPVPSEWPPQGSEEEDSVPRSALPRVTVGSLVEALLEDELLSVAATSRVILSVGDILWLLRNT